jgi:hypothetical protein
MTENFYAQPDESKLYHSESILLATFFGGPLVGGYMTAENFKLMGEPEKAKQSWVFALVGIFMLIAFMQFLQLAKIPWYVLPLAYTALTYIPMKFMQGRKIQSHLLQGGALHKGDRVFVVGFVGAVATFLVLLIANLFVQAATTGVVS